MRHNQPEHQSALTIDNLSHRFASRLALDKVDLSVQPGRFCILLGLNGAGKSTLFSLITRLYASQSGEIRVFGHDVNREPGEALRRMGVVFQARTLDLELSVEQNLLYHAALHGLGTRDARARSAIALAQVGMADRARDKARDLSGGQVRRVEIARALLHQPRLLLLDEPTVGLDMQARSDILHHVRALVDESRIGVLWTTHLLDEIRGSDDVVILHKGQVLDHGIADDIVVRAATPDIRAAFAKLTGSHQLSGAMPS